MGLQGARILVVEDAFDVLEILSALLRLEGAIVAGTGNGHDALVLAHQRHFDVLVTDLGLPDIPGDVLIREIIAAADGPLPIVVITGESEPHVTRAREAGAGAIFTKPLEFGRLVTHLTDLGLAPAA